MAIRIKNWEIFQHYKNRRPPWIRLYRDILDDPDFYEISGDDFKHLVMLWLIASEDPDLKGNLPASKTLAFRLRVASVDIPDLLKRLNHWVIFDDSDLLADCTHNARPDQIRPDQIRPDQIRPDGDPAHARSNTNNETNMNNKRPESINYNRSNLTSENRKLGDILAKYFTHLAISQLDEWAVLLNSEYGPRIDLLALFEEVGKTYRGNPKKVEHGKEWGHLRLWCRNADGRDEFAKGKSIKGSRKKTKYEKNKELLDKWDKEDGEEERNRQNG